MAYNSRFEFCGKLVIPREDSKRGFITEKTTRSGKKALSLNFGIKETDHNMAFCEMFGFVTDEILTMSVDNEKISIPWAFRNEPENIDMVANYKKFIVDFGEKDDPDSRKEFITECDAIAYIRDNIENYIDKKFIVSGQMSIEPYNGRYYTKYKVQRFIATDDNAKSKLYVTADLYYNKDSLDKADWNKEHILTLDAYVPQYISKDEGVKYVPFRTVLNCQKLDFNNPSHLEAMEFKRNLIEVGKKDYYHMVWKCHVINGSEEVEFTEKDLTAMQRRMIELKMKTLKDFQKNVYGDRVQEFRLNLPELNLDGFENGVVKVDMKPAEFEELIYTPAKNESLDEVIKKAEAKKEEAVKEAAEESTADAFEEDDLFD